VWPDAIVEGNNLTVAVSGLRKVLSRKKASPRALGQDRRIKTMVCKTGS
jgi:DNA-binding winged helix-turn-helix (wHTH) protein